MPIDLSCKCGRSYRVADALAGRSVRCKQCGTTLKVPLPELETLEPMESDNPFDEPGEEYNVAGEPPAYPQQTATVTPPNAPQTLLGHWMESLVVDGGSVASNSAGASVDLVKYFVCHPLGPAFAIVGLIVGVAGGIFVHPALLIIAGVTVWMLVQEAIGVRAKFRSGDLNPAIILSDKPWRVAVFAQMQTGGRRSGVRPAVWIRNLPMQKMIGGPPQVGMPLAAVCHYHGSSDADAWNNIDPTIVNLGLSSAGECNRILRRIGRNDWKQLERAIGTLPSHKPGLYKLWQGGKNAYVTGIRKVGVTLVVLVPVILGVVAIGAKVMKRTSPTAGQSTGGNVSTPREANQSPAAVEPVRRPPVPKPPPRSSSTS